MTTWSAFGIRCTFMSSARSRARWMSTFANVLWPPFRCLSAMQSGCSENFAPHAMTVATSLVDDQRPRPGRGASGWRTAPGRRPIQNECSEIKNAAPEQSASAGASMELTLGARVSGTTDVSIGRRSGCCCCGPAVAERRHCPGACLATCRRSEIRCSKDWSAVASGTGLD